MNQVISNLTFGDEILATLDISGTTIASVNQSNFNTIDDVVRHICAITGRFMGLARLTIRNRTQGWKMVMALATKRAGSAATPRTEAALPTLTPPHHGRQYLIPW